MVIVVLTGIKRSIVLLCVHPSTNSLLFQSGDSQCQIKEQRNRGFRGILRELITTYESTVDGLPIGEAETGFAHKQTSVAAIGSRRVR